MILPFVYSFHNVPFNFQGLSPLESTQLMEKRENLTLRVTVLCPDWWGYSLYLGGDLHGTWLSRLPMIQVSPDTWQFDISYNNDLDGYICNNCDNDGVINAGESMIFLPK